MTLRRAALRLVLYPIAAVAVSFAFISAFNPEALHSTVQPNHTTITEYAWR